MTIRRILVPVDASPRSRRATTYAAELAETIGAELYLLHVTAPAGDYLPLEHWVWGKDSSEASLDQDIRAAAGRALDAFVADLPAQTRDKIAQVDLETGVPYDVIVERAAGFDLVVMATHGRSGAQRALLGSVAERVVRHAPCPVLTVR